MSNPLYFNPISVLGGAYKLKDEHGIPVDLTYEYFKERGISIDWMEALAEALYQDVTKMDSLLKEIKLLLPSDFDLIYTKFKILFMHYYNKNKDMTVQEVCYLIIKDKQENSEYCWEEYGKVLRNER